jgi:hypothetical protein
MARMTQLSRFAASRMPNEDEHIGDDQATEDRLKRRETRWEKQYRSSTTTRWVYVWVDTSVSIGVRQVRGCKHSARPVPGERRASEAGRGMAH